MPKIFRQGDVLLRQIDKLPESIEPAKDNVLALGEVTGHSHRILNAQVFEITTPARQKYVQIEQEAELVHDEHGPIVIPQGIYEVVRQREYNPAENHTVSD